MSRNRILLTGALIGVIFGFLQFSPSGSSSRDVSYFIGAAIGGALLTWLVARAAGWIK